MEQIIIQSVIEKVDAQEKKISEMQTAINNISDNSEEIESIKSNVQELNSSVNNLSFPIGEMKELTKTMVDVRIQLSRPVTNTVEHHHYYPKILWLTIIFFIAWILVSVGWFVSDIATDDYKANDTKYRFLKLYGNNSLKEALFTTDSLYRMYPGMRDSVIQKENENRDRFEMLQKANNKENEAKELRKKAKGR